MGIRIRPGRWPLFFLALFAAAALGGEAAPAARDGSELDEVEVVGKKLRALYAEAVAAEDRFFAKYNELNPDRDFDVKCVVRPLPNSLVGRRECSVNYFRDAQGEWGRNFYDGVVNGGFSAHAGRDPADVARQRNAEYRKAIIQAFERHPELVELQKEREASWKRYEAERRKRMDGHLVLVE